SYPISVIGTEHDHVRQATATLVVAPDTDLPTAQPPATSARSRSVMAMTAVQTITGWAPATDPTTPITGYELERSVDGGSWSTVDATTAAVRSAIGTQTFNHAYQYRIRARDSADNWSTWVPGPTVTSVLVPDTSSAVRYGGTWHRSANVNASGGS